MLNQELRYKIFKILKNEPELSQRELADSLGISLGKTNYCIKALVERGLVKVQRFRNSQNKLAYMYILTPSGLEEKAKVTFQFFKRKQKEYENIVKELEELKKEASLVGSLKD